MWKQVNGTFTRVANTSATEISHTASGAGSYVLAVFSPGGQTESYNRHAHEVRTRRLPHWRPSPPAAWAPHSSHLRLGTGEIEPPRRQGLSGIRGGGGDSRQGRRQAWCGQRRRMWGHAVRNGGSGASARRPVAGGRQAGRSTSPAISGPSPRTPETKPPSERPSAEPLHAKFRIRLGRVRIGGPASLRFDRAFGLGRYADPDSGATRSGAAARNPPASGLGVSPRRISHELGVLAVQSLRVVLATLAVQVQPEM
jgi:hypothetical protein